MLPRQSPSAGLIEKRDRYETFQKGVVVPDETFDAVIIGGGSKALYLALYLVKYAGMSVGIFERRYELGSGLVTEEIASTKGIY